MREPPSIRSDDKPFELQGHTLVVLDAVQDFVDLADALGKAGFPPERTIGLQREAGIPEFDNLMQGSQWGESAEKVHQNGKAELESGHFLLLVETQTDEQAAQVKELAILHHGRGIYHFGYLVDTRLSP